ncbi:MAG: hypothetical protein QOE65_2163 [Solirubrobacteraceae bacterium]|jgi:voltage-gated potassium channel Kch|nr:hypothetical protein [Solirubrobacteraceae bacterium]
MAGAASPHNTHARRGVRLRRWWARSGWAVLAGLLGLSFTLGCIGADRVQSRPLLDLVYESAQLVFFQNAASPDHVPWELEVARFGAPIFAALLGFGGLVALVRRHEWKMARVKDHTIVCGIGRSGSTLATALNDAGTPVVGVTRFDDSAEVLRCRARGIPIRIADASDPEQLVWAGVDRAKRVIAACGDDDVNAEIAAALKQLSDEGYPLRDDLTAFIHIAEPELAQLIDPLLEDRYRTFNVYQDGARAMLREHVAPVLDAGPPPLVLIVGFGSLGQSVALEAQAERYGDRIEEILVVDGNARERVAELLARMDDDAPPVRLRPIELDVEGADFETTAFLTDADRAALRCALVCFDDEPLALTSALTLHRRLDDNVSVVVRVSGHRRGLADLIDHPAASSDYRNLHAFRLLENACEPRRFEL